VKVEARSCAQCSRSFTPGPAAKVGRFCSPACYLAARKKHDVPVPLPCETCGEPLSATQRRAGKFCSRACYWRSNRKPQQVIVCAQCGQERSFPSGRRPAATFCSKACSARSQQRRIERICEQCGTPYSRIESHFARENARFCSNACAYAARRSRWMFPCARCGVPLEVFPFQVRKGRRFCSRACAREALRKARPKVVCVGCGTEFSVFPSEAGGRTYCRLDCYLKAVTSNTRTVACRMCGTERRVIPALLAKGYGNFCSRACYVRSLRRHVSLECRQCHRRSQMRPSVAARREFCSRKCAARARAPRQSRCRVCRATFRAPAWRQQRYCGLSCANRGRHRRRSPEKQRRNDRVLELHAEGLDAFRIAKRLEAELGLVVAPPTVRTILFRERSARRSARAK
jgi:hypothetical protein